MKLVIGASGGVGQGLLQAWSGQSRTGTYHRHAPQGELPEGLQWLGCDVTKPDWAESLLSRLDVAALDTVVLAVGVLHDDQHRPEKSIRHFDRHWFSTSMLRNAVPFAELASALQDQLPRHSQIKLSVVSAKVGSIADNRLGGWHSYRASKAALNMLVTNVSLEWRHRLPKATVVALHPGTTDSGLSAPFQKGLPPGQLHSPAQTGQALAGILARLKPADTGQFIGWDGTLLPW
ncbi:MAG: SDR family NAD(P)-dependent oxidoreductase [Saccharospirillum sp.]